MTRSFSFGNVSISPAVGSLTDVVVSVVWSYGEGGDSLKSIGSELSFKAPDPSSFIPLSDISEETMKGWVIDYFSDEEAGVDGLDVLNAELDAFIESLKAPKQKVRKFDGSGRLIDTAQGPHEDLQVIHDGTATANND